VFKGDFERAAGAGSERRGSRLEDGTRLAKDDLAKRIGELDGEFQAQQGAIAGVEDFAVERGDFLI
jgi:hypothetical protein